MSKELAEQALRFALNSFKITQGGVPMSLGFPPLGAGIGTGTNPCIRFGPASAESGPGIKININPDRRDYAVLLSTAENFDPQHPGTWVININAYTFMKVHRKTITYRSHDKVMVSAPKLIGALSSAMFHELIHRCLGHGIMHAVGPESCLHLAIEASTAKHTCDVVGQLCQLVQPGSGLPQEQRDYLHGIAQGLCAEHKRMMDKWNHPRLQEVAFNCWLCQNAGDGGRCLDLGLPTRPDFFSDCDGCLVELPKATDGGFPNGEVIPDCPHCPCN